ncbi:hypothetical protein QJS83_04690 [Bdellovibrio sp. 22V]|uniref:hypothetical protein n=1 Tax=Bdellovibrio TaxID=958 RepID=UPI002542FACF|nr:hypothetical protein [Bdellovibrio sp. 22V]WII73169.1 hypothetical protein QJS83_04690 [Bdellovibrio sp. 22V]
MMFVLFLVLMGVKAQALTSEQVLKTAWNDKTYLSYDGMESVDSRNPLRNVEGFVNTESNSKNSDRETEFGLKFQLKSWPEWRLGEQKKDTDSHLLKDSSLGWALRNRYTVLLFVELNRQKMKYVDEAIRLADGYLKAQTLALQAGRGSSKSFLSAKTDLYKFQRLKNALEQEKEVLRKKLEVWVVNEKSTELEPINLISVKKISEFLQGHSSGTDSLTKKLAKEEINQMTQELEIVRGRDHQWIKAFEVSQSNNDDETKYKLGINIQIPGLGYDTLAKQKLNDLTLKRALKQRDLEETTDRLQTLKVQILNLIDIYGAAKKLPMSNAPGSLDPLANIERKISMQEEQIELLNQQQEITNLYIDYLLESEILIKHPEPNYLVQTAAKDQP